MRRSRLDLRLEIPGNNERSPHGDASNGRPQLTDKRLPFITQGGRIDGEVIRRITSPSILPPCMIRILVAIEDFNPALGSLYLRAQNATWLYLFVAYGICFVSGVQQR